MGASTSMALPPDQEAAQAQGSGCPFGHGTVRSGPYPGYRHGKFPAVCATGCTPGPPPPGETPRGKLEREAREYCELYYRENHLEDGAREARWDEIARSIEETGTYELTLDELNYGAKVSWRNAPKCSNRSKWQEMSVIDCRGARTNREAFGSLLEMLEGSLASGATVTRMCVFRARRPDERQGPRIWNGMLLRFAGYEGEGGPETGGVLGDPADAAFTAHLQKEFGWKPPAKRTAYDPLPLLLQMDETERPELFEIPSAYRPLVRIRHPQHRELDPLGLQWWSIPVVSGLTFSCGGLEFSACPFVGWFADTEVVRNLTDSVRYNVLPRVAEALRLDTSPANELWRDQALLAVNEAVTHSFAGAGVSVVSHHAMLSEFLAWYRREKLRRGYCPGNWKWIVPPVASSTCEGYLALNKMTEYTLSPAILPPRPAGWRNFSPGGGAPTYNERFRGTGAGATAEARRRMRRRLVALRCAARMAGRLALVMRRNRVRVAVFFATVTGNAERASRRVRSLLGDGVIVRRYDLGSFRPGAFADGAADADALVFVTSTYGSGAPPPDAEAAVAWLREGAAETHGAAAPDGSARATLAGRPVAVLGLGSSAYPRFCGAADELASLLGRLGARAVVPTGKVDALGGSEAALLGWCAALLDALRAPGALSLPGEAPAARAVRASPSLEFARRSLVKKVAPGDGGVGEAGAAEEEEEQLPLALFCGGPLARPADRWPGSVRARVRHVYELVPRREGVRRVFCVGLDASGAGPGALTFHTGDNIAVYPRQSAAAVARAAAAFGWDDASLDDGITLQPRRGLAPEDARAPWPSPTTRRVALERFMALDAAPTEHDVRRLARHLEGADRELVGGLLRGAWQRRSSRQLLAEAGREASPVEEWVRAASHTWVTLFEALPSLRGAVPLAKLLQMVPPVHPRYYSVSSSPQALPDGRVDLTVGLESWPAAGGAPREGLCSSFLGRLGAGDDVDVRVVRTPSFKLPLSVSTPCLLVGAGTGVAPFRGFLQERAFRLREEEPLGFEAGPFVVLLGFRSREEHLHAAEHAALPGNAELLLALSREPGAPRQHVQDVIRDNAEGTAAVRRVLALPKATVFVCGSARVAEAVRAAIDDAAGAGTADALLKDGRYHEDVFGST